MAEPIHIDGSFGEGGGQIIRTAASLAAITGRAVQIVNVRAGRSRPGLQPQHLAAVRAAAEICNARLSGDAVGSTAFLFEPQSTVQAGDYHFEIGTAGAAPLVAQTVIVPLALAGGSSRVRISGGTHVPHAPTADYLEAVYIPALRRAGLDVSSRTLSAGFYPLGGGEIELEIAGGGTSTPLDLSERPKLNLVRGVVLTSGLAGHVAERGAATIRRELKKGGRAVLIDHREASSPGPGASVLLVATCRGVRAGFSGVGARGKPMEAVASEPCVEFESWWKSGAACDEHLADQLVLPLILASGQSRWTTPVASEHLRTVLWVAQKFLPIQFTIEEPPGGPVMVQVEGAKV